MDIDDLDAEIERNELELCKKMGVPLVGNDEAQHETISALKHADDTVLIATTAENLQFLLDIDSRRCCKWQLTPQALKCDIMVFENTGHTVPT